MVGVISARRVCLYRRRSVISRVAKRYVGFGLVVAVIISVFLLGVAMGGRNNDPYMDSVEIPEIQEL